MRFMGSYLNSMDAKGRVSLPARSRKAFTLDYIRENELDPADEGIEIELYVTLSYDNEVRVYTAGEFDKYVSELFANKVNGDKQFDSTEVEERRMFGQIRKYTGSTLVDSAGRITVPEEIRTMAGLGKKVLVEGSGSYVAIWNPERRDAFLDGEDVGGLINDLVAKRKQRIAEDALNAEA